MELLSAELKQYLRAHTSSESDVLVQVRRNTHLKALYPQMLTSPEQGRLLSFVSHMLRPRLILEVGTYTAYGSICLAEGLAPEGKLITLEVNEEQAFLIDPHLEAAGLSDRVEVRYGEALALIPALPTGFDLIYIDADKQHYPEYYQLLLPRLRQGGFILADNVLWRGEVLRASNTRKETEGIRRFNQLVRQDPRVSCLMQLMKDGLMWIRKK